MSAVEISIKADVKDAVDYLKDIESNDKRITRAILAGVGSSTRNAIKKDYKHHFKKRSGLLYKKVKRTVNKRGDTVFITPWARGINHVLYGYALAQGSEIKPRDEEYMRFQIEGKWITSHGFKLPSEDWVEAPAKAYLSSPQYREQLDKIMAKQIEKIEKRRNWK